MNRFTEEINIHSDIAIDAIIKYANYIHGGEVWARSKRDYAALQARCDRYEKALESIQGAPMPANANEAMIWVQTAHNIANEALSGDGEKEVENELCNKIKAELEKQLKEIQEHDFKPNDDF
jgi:hypothetical protein